MTSDSYDFNLYGVFMTLMIFVISEMSTNDIT